MEQVIQNALKILKNSTFNTSIKENIASGILEVENAISEGNDAYSLRLLSGLYNLIDDKEPMSIEFHSMKLEIDDLLVE